MKWDLYTGLSFMFLILILGFTVAIICILTIKAKRDKAEFRREVRSWKYGKFLWVYLLAFPLFILSFAAEGQSAGYCIFKSLTNAFKLMALQFDFDLALVATNQMYKVTIYTCYTVATLNVILFVVSCVNQSLRTFINTFILKHRLSRKDIILGNTLTSTELYKTSPKKTNGVTHNKAIFDVMDKDEKWDLFAKGIYYVSDSSSQRLKSKLEDVISKFFDHVSETDAKVAKQEAKIEELTNGINGLDNNDPKREKLQKKIEKCLSKIVKMKNKVRMCIFINFDNAQKKEDKNIEYCGFLSETINNLLADKPNKERLLSFIDIYAYSSLKYSNVYKGYITSLKGCLHLVDKEKIIAYSFADEHPVALYVTKKQIDFNTSLLKDDVKISINFLGFGKTQQQIFFTLFSNTQFVKKSPDGKKIIQAPVDFNVYDIKDTTSDSIEWKNSIKNYSEWQNSNKDRLNEFYPLPELNTYHPFTNQEIGDINSKTVADAFNKTLENPDGKNINYIIISLGDDFKSIDVGNRIYNTIKANPEKYKNCFIFIRIDHSEECFNTIKLFHKEKDQVCLTGTCSQEQYSKFINDNKLEASKLNSVNYVIDCNSNKINVKFAKKDNAWQVYIEGNESEVNKINNQFFNGDLDIHCKRFIYGSYFKPFIQKHRFPRAFKFFSKFKHISKLISKASEDTSSQVYYDYKRIVPDSLTKIAIMQDKLYDAMSKYGQPIQKCLLLSKDKDVVEENRIKWSLENGEYERNSSFQSALNLRSKLLLMGLDYEEGKYKASDAFATYKAYWDYLGGNNQPILDGNILTIGSAFKCSDYQIYGDKSPAAYNNIVLFKDDIDVFLPQGTQFDEYDVMYQMCNDQTKYKQYINGDTCLYFVYNPINDPTKEINNRRWAMVNLEHNRWNAYIIAHESYLPLEKNLVSSKGKTKDRNNKKNACITTMDGLVALQKDWFAYEAAKQGFVFNNKTKKWDAPKTNSKSKDKIDLETKIHYATNKINYDYLQFDPAWHLLKRVGCKIVYSKNCPDSIKK